ncbi:MBL fold metallo-hydrolase [Nocardia huaxiensis]|uniref:MBL fold metallo-hydrolase n=1 Tax=Nocardia huaxiensis TaxID=2755382 RepID=A0A7D6VBQ3_9NOCA|nr:MBL fold metallo-hydrolase [Nocardia huaxiensis]QLY32552.1 MBL fold metallo-hydrolase [Nocardia huaxiensis]UFS93721.1 MBL fold metallo-hydrolase [Nocardia huaxiensis]
MRVHHLECGNLDPLGGEWLWGMEFVVHCLLVEHDTGLLLVDTGLGEQAARRPDWLGRGWSSVFRPGLDPAISALAQIESLGYTREDVRDIVLTHLDLDHAGGLADFPDARVHLFENELRAMESPRSLGETQRYRAPQLRHGPRWQLHSEGGDSWFGFAGARTLPGIPEEVVLVPLAGHSRGHAGVALRTGDSWLLHAGDSYFGHLGRPEDGERPWAIAAFEAFAAADGRARRLNHERLSELARDHTDDVTVFSAHCGRELRALWARASAMS